ncbi:MAG: hypothetical protein JWN25_1352 [Verrucomicrobiales bacterium]|nr:hypothetical protein [Verrucomicrobiales bacterium]MDB6131433.1 hypothetical protein [Verrucomicrobiales bacterium]
MNRKVSAAAVLAAMCLLAAGCKTERAPSAPPVSAAGIPPASSQVPLSKPITQFSKTISLFDGKSLAGWKGSAFGTDGEIMADKGALVIGMGGPLSGVTYTNDSLLPKIDYEIELDARRTLGNDFFCGLTFPVADSFCTLIVGGWGGTLVGLSSLDDLDASENETTKFLYFEDKRWYHIRLAVLANRMQVWIDKDKVIDVNTTGKKISLRSGEIALSKPLGFATYSATAELKNIVLKTN